MGVREARQTGHRVRFRAPHLHGPRVHAPRRARRVGTGLHVRGACGRLHRTRPFRRWSRRSGCDLEIPDPRLRRRLQLPAPGRLATEQEGLRILSLSADLEGAEVLVPGAVRSLRLRLPPELEIVQASAVIFLSRSRSNRCSRRGGGRSFHRIFGISPRM
jgi:hypothetical protein